MGILQSRPEEPDEWAGLPAEPAEPGLPGEVLVSMPPAIDGLGFLDGGVGVSLDLPMETAADPATTDGDDAEG